MVFLGFINQLITGWSHPVWLSKKGWLLCAGCSVTSYVPQSQTSLPKDAEGVFLDRQIDINSVQTRHVTVMCLFLHTNCGTSDSSKVFTISMTGMMMSLFTGRLFGPTRYSRDRASKHHTLTDMHLSV